MINFSNSTPAAPMGSRNIAWQNDVSGNVSAYIGLATIKTTVAPVAGVVTIDMSKGNSFFINVNAAITSIVFTNPTDGQEITLLFAQDSTGYAVTTPANLLGSYTITTTANKHSCYKWSYNAADTNFYQVGANNM
jgi:hypothetical protein